MARCHLIKYLMLIFQHLSSGIFMPPQMYTDQGLYISVVKFSTQEQVFRKRKTCSEEINQRKISHQRYGTETHAKNKGQWCALEGEYKDHTMHYVHCECEYFAENEVLNSPNLCQ